MKKHLLKLSDLSKADFDALFKRALDLKDQHKKGTLKSSLAGRTLGLLFDKPSTRTRVSFETAMAQLGGTPIFISSKDTQMSRDEPLKDTARVLSRYLDGVAMRTFSQEYMEEFASYATIPVMNALTDAFHPCQILSDIQTVIEHKGGYEGLKIAWIGDGNNVAQSWINAAGVLGLHLSLACPQGYRPAPEIVAWAESQGGATISISDDPVEAIKEADVVNTDVWASMGQEQEQIERQKAFASYQVDSELMQHAAEGAIVLHCLPAHRGEEISETVLEGPSSVVWDQAENKMHMHRAVLEMLITGE